MKKDIEIEINLNPIIMAIGAIVVYKAFRNLYQGLRP